jgi:acetyl esterase/lipase
MTRLDEAYANSKYIPDGEGYYTRWAEDAAAFRAGWADKALEVRYGDGARQTYDVFSPDGASSGTVIFVHGGYWMASGPRDFSHLARGALGRGLACAMPSYTLAPDARIGDITREIALAVDVIAAQTTGAIYLAGHSAGAHLVARMACVDMAAEWSGRVRRVMAISPLSDLAPLMDTTMNDTLKIDADEARRESPIHHVRQDIPVTAWVGSAERPAFLDQAKGLHDVWACDLSIDADRHHFDVIEGLEDPASAVMRALLR